METEGLDFKGALRDARRSLRRRARDRGRGPARPPQRRQRRERLYRLLGRAADLLRALPVGGTRGAGGARVPARPRACARRRCASSASATRRAPGTGCSPPRAAPASATRSCSRSGWRSARRTARARSTTASASGSCSPRPTPAGTWSGFGARAMRENQRPKYLNTAEGELYQKRRQLFGLDRARAPRRAGRQRDPGRGLHRRARAPPGRARERGRDHGDRADRGADRRARARAPRCSCCASTPTAPARRRCSGRAKLTDDRNLELRVVPLPEGTDPAELIERAGADALRERVAASVPFVAFHVDRILERNDTRSAEGRDRAFRELQPALEHLERGPFGDELAAPRRRSPRSQPGAARDLIRTAHGRLRDAAARAAARHACGSGAVREGRHRHCRDRRVCPLRRAGVVASHG